MRPLAAQELDKGFAGVASWRSEKTMVAVVFVAVAVPVSLLIWTAAGLLSTSRVCAVSDAIPAASLKMDGSGAFGVLSMATRACGGGSGAAGLGSLLGQSDGGGCGVSGTDGVGCKSCCCSCSLLVESPHASAEALGGKLVGWLLRLLLIEALCGNIILSISGVAYLCQIVTRQGFSRRHPNSCMFKASWTMETFFRSPCSSIQVDDSIRVEYRQSSRLLSIGLQSVLLIFDGELLDNILLSPVKLKKNLRLNNKPRIAPFPWRQPKGSPVYQAVCTSSVEARGRGRHGIAAVPCRSRSLLLFGLSWRMFFLVQLALPSKWMVLFFMSYLLWRCSGDIISFKLCL
uniref:Uncharacterized protein n=1 Tax=Oryza nivara TaxID=4536 RepID=A0A0E0GVS0_ORYNI